MRVYIASTSEDSGPAKDLVDRPGGGPRDRGDGTAEGTWLLDDVEPGYLSSSPRSFVAAGERVFLSAGTVECGFELFAFAARALHEKPGQIFSDGFESGDTTRWSCTAVVVIKLPADLRVT